MFLATLRGWYSHQAAATSVTRSILSRAFPSPTIFCLPYIGLRSIRLWSIQVEPLLSSSIIIGQSLQKILTILPYFRYVDYDVVISGGQPSCSSKITTLSFGKKSLPTIFCHLQGQTFILSQKSCRWSWSRHWKSWTWGRRLFFAIDLVQLPTLIYT